jgi:flagellar M-ring protein FliF
MSKSVIETKVDPKTIPLMSKTDEVTESTTSNKGSAGPPGLDANGASPNRSAALPGAGGGGSQSETSKTSTQTQNAASHGSTTTQLAGLTPRRTTVAVAIPSDYFELVWHQRNPAADGQEKKKPDAGQLTQIQDEETKKIRDHVASLIPQPVEVGGPPIDPKTLVTVTTFSRVPLPPIAEPSMVDRGLDWLAQSWNTLAMVGLALVALLMLRSYVSAIPPGPEMPQIASTTISDEGSTTAPAGAAAAANATEPGKKQRLLQRKTGTGGSLREELVEMVREDPDAAASILRGWIGNVG